MNKLEEICKLLTNDGFNCKIESTFTDRTDLECGYRGCKFVIVDREQSDKLNVYPLTLRSDLDAGWYFQIDVPAVNISKSKDTDTIYRELHKRFIADFLHESEIALKKRKDVDQALNMQAVTKKELGEYIGVELDTKHQWNSTFLGDHYIKIGVTDSIELSVSKLTMVQAKAILDIIK